MSCVIALINLAGPVVFNDIVSLTVASLLLSYFLVCSLLLWRRCTGLLSYDAPASQRIVIGDEKSVPKLNWGPWHVRGSLGTFINVLSCIFLAITIFFSFWPLDVNPAASKMNMSVVMFGGTTLFAIIWYVVQGKKTWQGPVIDLGSES